MLQLSIPFSHHHLTQKFQNNNQVDVKICLQKPPSIFPVKGASKEGLTVAGRELAFHCKDDYTPSLAISSHS